MFIVRNVLTRSADEPRQQGDVIALHQLEASAEIRRDPAVEELEAFGHQSPFLRQAAADGFCVLVAKAFDDHEKHVRSPYDTGGALAQPGGVVTVAPSVIGVICSGSSCSQAVSPF